MRYIPSRREFVILEGEHRGRLKAIAAIETDGAIVRLSVDGAPYDGWRQLRAALGEDERSSTGVARRYRRTSSADR